ncbi:hypothetical protein A3D42_01560 [Candidatus Nomurabacteria bacterium RIFCSPHIGHO2_02_FULL_41_18]|uniref:Uncharacterized protein n=1 Tax=Candidatus Nomurabacteria bacterium RIFCSPHIGHO2_02_FULL_41_18 TaxID=1801754 RepID=A0A1F6W7H9_9BACT|nr:MAG: hypothetical protein A2737_00235 [Candidatus Nomurabacteria bacterium RIFCSPHIGHO2_01_FULL_41_71]OGI77878.1 MAG: hypothetical protein A3D42_01560 [Candidatus Nomurabacteria bacterium RIFCSPHIGHO2_02_FULL_41_18]OGI90018.1 MAG: hypothetical protein A3B01_02065 [Candidatus Nomurabacteria bacterium RIFCSPLOWO2_01_FULL_41_52b]
MKLIGLLFVLKMGDLTYYKLVYTSSSSNYNMFIFTEEFIHIRISPTIIKEIINKMRDFLKKYFFILTYII